MQYRGVFFDFDYTLGDSTIPIVMGYQEGFRAMGWPAPTQEQVRPTIGMTLMDGYTMLTGDGDEGRRQEFYHRFQEAVGELAQGPASAVMIERTRLLPGAAQLLSALKERGVKVGVVSTKLGVTIRRIFVHHALDAVPDVIIGGEDVTRPKPDPEGLELALSRVGLTGAQTLFCGDTVIDACAARGAGLDFCAVLNGTTLGYEFDDYPHVHIAGNLDDVRRWLGL